MSITARSSMALKAGTRPSVVSRAIVSRTALRVFARKTVTGKSAEADRKAFLLSLPGVTAPFQDVFDPASLSATASIEDIRRWRESEITHGRVAMLAALGFLVGEQLEDFPAFFNFDGRISGPAITHFNKVGQGFWEPLLIFIGLAESYRVNVGWASPTSTGFNTLKEEYNMGDLGFDPLGLKPEDEDELKIMQTKELNNGRLAMIAIAVFAIQEVAEPGVEIFQHFFFDTELALIEELDVVEKDLGLPLTELPKLAGL